MNKKLIKTITVFAMVLFVGICFGKGNLQVKAASDLQQTEAQKKSVTVSWTADPKAVSYKIYKQDYSDKEFEKKFDGDTTATSYTLRGLKPGTKYKVYVYRIEADGEEFYISSEDVVTLPDKLTGLKQERWYYFTQKLYVKWGSQTAADQYEIRLYDSKNKLKKKELTKSEYTTTTSFKIKNNNVYKVQVRSIVKLNGKTYKSKWGTIYCLNQPMLSKVKIKGNKLELKWGKINGATEHRVYVSQKLKSGYKKVATVKKSKNTCTVKKFNKKKFSSKKKYYVYVEAVCKKSGTSNTSGCVYCWDTKRGGGEYRYSYR